MLPETFRWEYPLFNEYINIYNPNEGKGAEGDHHHPDLKHIFIKRKVLQVLQPPFGEV